MSELIDTTEMYLRTIFELHEEGIEPLRARIAERLHQSGPTVSQTVARLERDGLLSVRGDRHLELSPAGWQRARDVMRKHRLAERMLSDMLGFNWADVHEEACKLEHVMSDQLEARLDTLLSSPEYSTYGCPIPSRTGVLAPEVFRDSVVRLTEVLGGRVVNVELVRLSEFVQADLPALAGLDAVGLRPGARFDALWASDAVEIRGPEGRVRIDQEVATGMWVADRAPGE